MAIAVSNLASSTSPGLQVGTPFVSASFTPSDNSILTVTLTRVDGSTSSSYSIAGGGLTWTPRNDVETAGSSIPTGVKQWTAPVATGASMTVTITASGDGIFTGGGANPDHISVDQATGYNSGDPVGLLATDQLNGSNTGTLSFSLGGTTASDSAVIAAVACDGDNGAALVDAGASWTVLSRGRNSSENWYRGTVEYRIGALSTADFGALNDPYQYAAAAIEIKAASSGTSITVPQGNLVLSSVKPDVVQSITAGQLALSSVAPSVVNSSDLLLIAPTLSKPILFILRGHFKNQIPASIVWSTVDLTIPQGDLVLSTVAASIDYKITVPQGNLVISSVAVSIDLKITPSQGNLTLSSVAPSVGWGFTPAQGNLTISSVAPTVQAAGSISPPAGQLALSSVAPNVVQSVTSGQLALSTLAPTVSVGTNITVPQGNLALSSVAPNVVQSVTAGQLTISSVAPSVVQSITAGQLVLSSVAPLATVGTSRIPPTGDLTLSSVGPTQDYKITIPQGNLALSPTAPTVSRSIPSGNLVLSSVKPDVVVSITAGQLVLSPTAPTIQQTFHRNLTIPQGNLSLSPTPPDVGGNISRTPPAGNLVLSPSQPSTVPRAGNLVISSVAPTVFATDPHPVTVPQGNLKLSTLPAQLVPGVYFYPDQRDLKLSSLAPDLTFAHTHHWRRTANLQGDVIQDKNLQGSLVKNNSVAGSVDLEQELEAD